MIRDGIALQDCRLSLSDLVGRDYVEALCEARAFLTGGDVAEYLALADEKVSFFPESYRKRLDSMLDAVGTRVLPGLAASSPGAATGSVAKATNRAMAPMSGLGFYRVGEDGRLYLITKSEHYHAPLGHSFPGYRLVQIADQLGVPNATHNNTRGHITRLLERELVRVANGLPRSDSAGLERVLASSAPHVLNRITNLETGSLAVEAALKAMLARFYRLEDHLPMPQFAGLTPVFLVIADHQGGRKANYHGTTILTQVMRDMWPELGANMAEHGAYIVKPVKMNDIADFQAVMDRWDAPPYKVAGFLHEIVLMNYGAIRLYPDYLRAAYDLCRRRDVPVLVDEIQSCIWSSDTFMFREYGLNPDFVSIGKGFPGGQYAASRILGTAQYDTMQQFGALVTNGQEELASLSYLVTMTFTEANRPYVAALGDYYQQRLGELAVEFSDMVEAVEGWRHLSALRFRDVEKAVTFMKQMNAAGYDVSAQTYKASCPPTILTKIPLISSYRMVDQFVSKMGECLGELIGSPVLA
jgi:acetylornithine/succinyldiaminopimelate/putrescine aminotransferase